jgi:hypothetical protein
MLAICGWASGSKSNQLLLWSSIGTPSALAQLSEESAIAHFRFHTSSRQGFPSLPRFRACLMAVLLFRGKQRSVVGRRNYGRFLRNVRAASTDLAWQRPSHSNVSAFSVIRCADGAITVC